MSNNLKRVLKTSKETNAILKEATGTILRSSFQTVKQIASLYKTAGTQTFGIGKEIVKKTFELSLDNQKLFLKTSGNAIKEISQSIRDNSTTKQSTSPKVKKEGVKSSRAKNKQKEVSIDDVLNQN